MTNGIYSFRGADITNILNFERDFKNAKIIKLEQNYRCTGNILKIANSVIKNNETKYQKKLWTENDIGNLPKIYSANDEYDEGNYIAMQIEHLRRQEGMKYSDFAILYRMNTQSRAIEQILGREGIPYKVVGGLKFFERKEIKDIICYLRLIQNPMDNLSLIRVINEPKRGIGKTSLDKIQDLAIENETSMYEIIKNSDQYGLNRVFLNSREFINSIEELRAKKDSVLVSELVKLTLKKTAYTKALEEEKTIEAENRIENLNEFLTVAMEFEKEEADNSLENFLQGMTLSSDIDSVDEAEESVTLMTLHSAKGLEFPVVFLVGLEEGIFPGNKSIGEESALEEERRLCYVGITRAKQNLFLTCSKKRTIFGSTSYNQISRFVREIPEELLDGAEEVFGGRTQDDFDEMDSRRNKIFGRDNWGRESRGRGLSGEENSGREYWGRNSAFGDSGYNGSSFGDRGYKDSSFGDSGYSWSYGSSSKSGSNSSSDSNWGSSSSSRKYGAVASSFGKSTTNGFSNSLGKTTSGLASFGRTMLGSDGASSSDKNTKGLASFGRTAESFLNGLANKSANKQVDLSKYVAGVRVFHKKFGEGVITATEPEDDDLKVDIDFDKFGHKRLMAKFSNLDIRGRE